MRQVIKKIEKTIGKTDYIFTTYKHDNNGKTHLSLMAEKKTPKSRLGIKVLWHYSMSSGQQAEEYMFSFIKRTQEAYDKREQEKATKRQAAKSFVHKYQIGDILYDSWGYEQTNVDFYQVVERTDKTIKIREIAGEATEKNHGDYGKKIAIPGKFVGEEIETKKVTVPFSPEDPGYVSSKLGSMRKWDGKPVHYSWGY